MRLGLIIAGFTLVALVTVPVLALALGVGWNDLSHAVTDRETLNATGVSLFAALLSVVFGVLLAVPAGYVIARRLVPLSRVWQALLDLPVVIPHPVLGIGLLLVFARNRLVGAALRENFDIQVVSALPGIVIAMLIVSSPIIVKAAVDGFRSVPLAYERAAQSLGASDARIFFTISLPLALRSIRSGALLAWARSVSEFGSIVIIAYYPRSASVLIWDRFSAYGLKAALAPAMVLLLVCLAVFLLLQAWESRTRSVEELQR